MQKHRWPILTLFLLAPAVGELLSGSAPPAEFFTPFGLILLSALYGSGAVLIRELVRRWDKGWASIFLLGLAYGIYEEGIVVRSFFDPGWPDLGVLAEYGRFWGVNWLWTIDLTMYHAVVSITIPILLVELLYPAHRGTPWLRRRGLIFFSLLLLAVMAATPLMGMQVSPLALLACVLVMALLAVLAYVWPARKVAASRETRPLPAILYTVLGFAATIGWVISMWFMPEQNFPVFIALSAALAWPLIIAFTLRGMTRRGMGDIHRWALALGVLLIFILLTFVAEAENLTRPDDTSGMALVGWTFLVFMLVLGFRTWRRGKIEPAITPSEPTLP